MLMLKPWKCRKCGNIIRNSLEDIDAEFAKHTTNPTSNYTHER